MTDHVLSEEEVNVMAECGASIYDYDFEELIASHRLLQKRVTELEAESWRPKDSKFRVLRPKEDKP